jgi:hypothetical protein
MKRSPSRIELHTDLRTVFLLILIGAFHLLTIGSAGAVGSEVTFRLTLLHSNEGELLANQGDLSTTRTADELRR